MAFGFDGKSKKILSIIAVVFLILLAILYAVGMVLSYPCYSIGTCKQCWDANDDISKNNAYVNLTMCACGKAYRSNFADPETNSQIEQRYKLLTNSTGDAKSICSGELPLFTYNESFE